jgi:hypothetical protein
VIGREALARVLAWWRRDTELDARAARVVADLMVEPEERDIDWLACVATGGDRDHAAWELRYARRSFGMIAAQRDALDDRTASAVARALAVAWSRDRRVDPDKLDVVERQFNARLSAYREGLDSRGGAATPVRMGQTLLAFAGGEFRSVDEAVRHAGELLEREMARASAALLAVFGTAVLPDTVPPSVVGRGWTPTQART